MAVFLALCTVFSVSADEASNTQTNQNAASNSVLSTGWDSPNFRVHLSEFDPIQKNGPNTSEISGDSTPSKGWKGIVQSLLERLSNLFLMVIPILAAISLIIAGYFYIFSFASDENVTKAKTIIKYNLIAMVVAFGSWAIISTLAGFFS